MERPGVAPPESDGAGRAEVGDVDIPVEHRYTFRLQEHRICAHIWDVWHPHIVRRSAVAWVGGRSGAEPVRSEVEQDAIRKQTGNPERAVRIERER